MLECQFQGLGARPSDTRPDYSQGHARTLVPHGPRLPDGDPQAECVNSFAGQAKAAILVPPGIPLATSLLAQNPSFGCRGWT